jgi:cytochrome P450
MTGPATHKAPASGLRVPNGPPGHFILGNLPQIARSPIDFLTSLANDYGDVARFRFLWHVGFLVNHPDYIRRILVENHRNYNKNSIGNQMLRPLLGNGLLLSEGDFWLRQRRLMQPAFHKQRIQSFGELMASATEEMMERWRAHDPNQALDISEEMMRLTLSIVGRALFSLDLSGEADTVGKAFSYSNEFISARFRQYLPPPLSWPTPANRRFHKARLKLVQVVQDIIDERRKTAAGDGKESVQDDLLGMLLEARDADTGEGMTDQHIKDEVMTLLLAGHETTANTLTWTFYLLSQNPEAEQKLRAELEESIGGAIPGFSDLADLPYNRMVIQESMRLYPPAWILSRKVEADDVLGDYHIPAGSVVDISPLLMQRHPKYWKDPLCFDPERFLPEQVEKRPQYAYFPFGGGPRLCIGRDFALAEAQIILAAVASRFKLRLAPGWQVELDPLITLRARGGMPMFIEERL